MPIDTQSPATPAKPDTRKEGSGIRLIVQAETNLLRFPFFALHTKGLRNVDFKEVRGMRTENGQSHEFLFRVSRNTDHFYPGPLSRKAHFALLSLLRKQGFPFKNPVAFSWRQLAREMQVAYGGSTSIDRLKEALLCTFGAMIKSRYALKSGPSRESLPARERGYNLYAECLFTNDVLPDGTLADQNYVTLADWYLTNLNSLYAAPLDYQLWNRLNDQSPLASRLYEFLLFNFSTGIDHFCINYEKLCQFLPAKVEPYTSQAKVQLDPAFQLLTDETIIRSVEWTLGRNHELQIQVKRGRGLSGTATTSSTTTRQPELFETVTTTEGTNEISPAERLVRNFHDHWSGNVDGDITAGELDAAKSCLSTYGLECAMQLLPKVIGRMKQQFPDAKTFGATKTYFQEVQDEQDKRERIIDKAKQSAIAEAAVEDQRQVRRAMLKAAWEALDPAEREAIRDSVLTMNPRLNAEKFASLIDRLCLAELDRRTGASATV